MRFGEAGHWSPQGSRVQEGGSPRSVLCPKGPSFRYCNQHPGWEGASSSMPRNLGKEASHTLVAWMGHR